MFSLFWFVLYLMDRLIHVKNDVQLSTPRGFYTTFRNLSDNSFLFSTPSTSPTSSTSSPSSSSSHFKSTRPAFTITFADGNVLDAFRLMNFHRSKMNEYLCDDFITADKITPVVDRFLDSETNKRNMAAKLIRDVGSNSYKTWLMRTINNGSKSEGGNSSQRRDELRFGYAEGRFKKPFYKTGGGDSNNLTYSNNNNNNNVEDEDIYFGTSFPAYHVNRYREAAHPINQSTRNRTSVIPITLSTMQKRRNPTQLIPNENIIGANLHDRYMNLTATYRKTIKNNVTPRDTFQRSDPSSNKETIAIYVTQNSPPSGNTDINTAYWTSDNNVEMSNSNGWPGQSDNNGYSMQQNPQIPAPDTNNNGDSFGRYYFTTIPAPPIDNNAASYTQYYPSITESPREYTYPPYYPPSDVANGYNAPVYGYHGNNIDPTSSTLAPVPPAQFPPQFSYQSSVTSTLYGYPPSITSWPYGWTSPTTMTTTQKPMVIGWMPMTPAPTAPNMPPPSTMPTMMGMIPMMPTPPPTAVVPTMPPSFNAVPMIPIYGFPPSMPPSGPPAMGWGPPTSTPLPYGVDYTFNPPNNQDPHFGAESEFESDQPSGMYNQQQFPSEFSNHGPEFSNDFSNGGNFADQSDYDSMQSSQDLQDMQDPRDNAISNILGPDAYELILTAIAFMAFGTYFMNTMLQLMQGNSPPTMMIIGNGGNNAAPPAALDYETRKFPQDDNLRLLDKIMNLIDEFHDWLNRSQGSDF